MTLTEMYDTTTRAKASVMENEAMLLAFADSIASTQPETAREIRKYAGEGRKHFRLALAHAADYALWQAGK